MSKAAEQYITRELENFLEGLREDLLDKGISKEDAEGMIDDLLEEASWWDWN